MCHLILLLPVLALPLFWIIPLSIAAPAYGGILFLSGWVYYLAVRAMQQPVKTGSESLMHCTGQVIDNTDNHLHIRIQNEVWNAESTDRLNPGDRVEVVNIEGLTLSVRRLGSMTE